jgi:hypothetical protein
VADFKSDLLAWISSVLDHIGVLGTGGVIVLLIQLAKDRWPAYFNWQTSRRVFLCFLIFSVFQSWESEYKSRIGREHDLVSSNHRIDLVRSELKFQQQRLEDRCEQQLGSVRQQTSFTEGRNQVLDKQNRDEQVLIAGCQSQALKLLTPEAEKMSVLSLDNDSGDNVAVHKSRWILLINKTLTPAKMVVSCNRVVESMTASVVGSPNMTNGSTRLAPNAWESDVLSPAWTTTNAMLISVSYRGSTDGMGCQIDHR